MRFNTVFCLVLIGTLLLALAACSGGDSSGSDSDDTSDDHPNNYLLQHASDAEADLASCRSCHGTNYSGDDDAVSCLDCHVSAPPFIVHADAYSDPDQHGAAAKADQRECLGCHGTLPNIFDGGVVSDPNLFNIADANCSSAGCHPFAGAHPTNWEGSVDDSDPTYNSTHRTVDRSKISQTCAMCHKVDGAGTSPNASAPSCFVADHTNSNLVYSGCHPGGY